MPIQLLGAQPHTIACSGLSRVRTELRHLLVIPGFAPHPVQTSGGVWGLERWYCMMIGGEAEIAKHLDQVNECNIRQDAGTPPLCSS